MHPVVDELLPVDTVLLLEVGIEARLDVLDDGLPAICHATVEAQSDTERVVDCENRIETDLLSLLTKSPKPGVSTTVRRSRTPFSSMSN